MPEPHPAPNSTSPASTAGAPPDRDAQPPGRPPHQPPVTGRIGRRQLQQPPGLVRQGVHLAGEAVLDPPCQRRRAGRPNRPPAPPGSARAAAPAAPADYPGSRPRSVPDLRVQRPGQRRVQQRPRVILPSPSTSSSGSRPAPRPARGPRTLARPGRPPAAAP